MANDRLYRENTFWGLAYPEAFSQLGVFPAAELNNSMLVKDLTCALWEDDTEMTLGDSESDDGLTFCSKAGETTPTFFNPTTVFTSVRDKDRAADGLFNMAFDHLAFPDITYFAIKRVGKPNTAPFVAGDEIQVARVKTDHGVDLLESGSNVRLQQSFLADDFTAWNVTVS